MKLRAAVIGILPKGAAVRDLEDLTGLDFGRICFARDFGSLEDALPAYDYVLITEEEAKQLPQARFQAVREKCNARWVLLTREEGGTPGWAEELDFQHCLSWPDGGDGEGEAPTPAQPIREGLRLALDLRSGELQAGDVVIRLTPRECRMMAAFLKRPNQVIRREELLREVWERDDHHVNVVQVMIRRLRQKLSAGGVPGEIIENSRGFGYRLRVAKGALV